MFYDKIIYIIYLNESTKIDPTLYYAADFNLSNLSISH